MKSYELMVIFTPVLSQDEYKAEAKKLNNFITENGGAVVAEDFWGLRQLAYPIQKKTTALYYVLECNLSADIISKFIIQLNRTESIMRHMFTVLDKHSIAYNAMRRGAPKKEVVKETTEETPIVNETEEA